MRRRGPRKADDGGARSRSSGEALHAREGGETEGKRVGDDVHLHAELRQRAGAVHRRQSGETAVSPSLAGR
jgi:hypothetical protein